MKINKLLDPWKGDKRFTLMSKQAAKLKKTGLSAPQIVAAISEEFGEPPQMDQLRETPQPCAIYGEVGSDIEASAVAQLELALRLPVAIRGALMPDGHVGVALPVGGVLATYRAVAPAMVGVDIGCRMHLTLFEESPEELLANREALFNVLQAVTTFGAGATRERAADHDILDDPRWKLTSQTRGLRAKAISQLGTSGAGNHFANLMVGETLDPESGLPRRFCALLTHSGSRGVGYSIANHYIRLAAQETAKHANIPRLYEWLDLDSEAGQEYWAAMELAGAFAQANHEVIHDSFTRTSKLTPLTVIQNHHNFAWREGDMVIHRKGATPAEPGVRGVIPGSMGSASYIVEGGGVADALNSAAHGAGRNASRRSSRATINPKAVRQLLKRQDVLVEGFTVDESPQAYKDIERVMNLQVAAGLIKPLARMQPVAVIMAGERGED